MTGVRFLLEEGLFVLPQQTGSLWSPPLSFSSNFIQILINLTFLSEDV